MKYNNIVKGTFLSRPNRFIAHVLIDGVETTVHVKNTGRCRELLQPRAEVYLERSDNPARKTQYDLVAVKKGRRLVNMDSQIPNAAAYEWISSGAFKRNVTTLRREVTFGNSRFDIYLEYMDDDGITRKAFVEVKGVTLEDNDVVRFPDAPTERGIKHILVPVDPFQIEGYELNPTDRCYVCKKMIFGGLIEATHEMGLAAVADGTNASDTGMYRPGMRALAELDVRSPLKEVGLTKDEIREISRRVGLPTAAKPSFACLMTRFQYGQRITEELLGMVGQAELFLLDEGFRQLRVRYHEGGIARIELAPQEMARMLEPGMAERVDARLHELGFQFVTLDLGGYATGKMNAAVEAALLEQQQ